MSKQTKPVLIQADREISVQDIEHIQLLLRRFPRLSRCELANTVCEHLDWLTPSGLPKLTACYALLDKLEKTGVIRLPAKQEEKSHPGPHRRAPRPLSDRTSPGKRLACPLKALKPVQLALTDPTNEALWNEYVTRYHPLGYKKPFGYRQRYFVEAGGQRLGCILLSGAAKALRSRDRWIGWSDRQRLKNLPWVLNNSRFLIFPWVEVPHLASHVLGQLARRVADDWQVRWGYRPLLLESFVDPARYAGTCYRAAGWELLGQTTGEGLVRPGRQYRTRPKLLFAKALQADFRSLLCSDQLKGRTEL